MAPSCFVRLQADPPEPSVRELGEVLRRLDLEFGEELIDGIHDDTTLVEDAIHEDVVDLEFRTERLSLAFRLLQLLRVRFEGRNLFLQRLRLSLEQMPRLPFGVEFALEGLEFRLRGGEGVLRGPELREVSHESRALRLQRLPLDLEVGQSSAHVADLAEEDRELIEPLSLGGLFKDRVADQVQTLLVHLGEGDRVELSERLDFRVVEGLAEPVAVVRLVTKVVLQLLELALVFREDERILVDRGHLLVDSGEGLLRAGLFLAQLPHEIRAVREPRQFAGDSCHPFLQSPFVSKGGERGLPVDVRPKRGDLAMQFIDPVLDLIPPLLVFPLREVELPLRRAGRSLPLLVRRLRLLQPVEFLAQAVEVVRLLLEEGAFGLELRGDLPLIPDFGQVDRSFGRSSGCSKISKRKSFWNTARRSDPLAAPSSFISSWRTKVEFRNPS